MHQRKINKLGANVEKDRWEDDYELIEYEGLFEEYLEMGEWMGNSASAQPIQANKNIVQVGYEFLERKK